MAAQMAKGHITHGLSRAHAGAYRSWKEMRQRVLNPNCGRYSYYGGRGITICARWNQFPAFLEDMGDRPDGWSLDRIDVNGNYEPSNCRWATIKTQCNNRRSNRMVTWRGETRTFQEWCDTTGVEQSKAAHRMLKGMSWDDVFANRNLR